MLLACYAFFIVGVILCGLGQTMWQVCIGRGISGVGGAGMGVIVSILITELVAARDVAVWRSYVNVVATTGRSIGGPLGGWLADTVGWRWSFIGQGPIMMGAFVLVAYGLKSHEPVVGPKGATPSKLGRIDFLGALLITSTIITFILAADLPSQDFSWTSPPVISLFMVAITLGAAFFYYEAKYALEPIFHPSLLVQRNVYTSYLGLSLATAAQVSMMYSVPLYFQITQRATNTQAGARLVPAVLGNTIGALSAGFYIKNTGRYKNLTIFAALSCATSYLVMILTWHGESSFLESLAIVPGGFGNGIAMASTFIALTANLPRKDIAVGTSGLYLMGSIGVVLGVSLSSSIQTSTLKRALEEQLPGLDGRKIIESVLSDVDYVKNLTGSLRDIVVGSYVLSLEYAHGKSRFSMFPAGKLWLSNSAQVSLSLARSSPLLLRCSSRTTDWKSRQNVKQRNIEVEKGPLDSSTTGLVL